MGQTFKDWKENVLIFLGCMDLDLVLRTEQPPPLIIDSFAEAKNEFERWNRSNHMSFMIIKPDILEILRCTVSGEVTTAKELLDDIEKRFVKNDKAKTNTLLGSSVSMKYQGQGNIRHHADSNIAS